MSNAPLSFVLLSALLAAASQPNAISQSLPQIVSTPVASESGGQTEAAAQTSSGSTTTTSPDSKPAAAPKKKPSPKADSVEVKRPPIEASMVGYIDNAIVGSEVRIRFDAAFNDAFPDRAEFIYGKCGCYRSAPVPFTDPNAPGPGPGIPKNINFQTLSFMGEYAPNSRFSAFVEIPFRWLQPQGVIAPPNLTQAFASSGGVGDVEAGLKFALVASPKTYLTLQLKSYLPTGDALNGLGTSHYSLEPALLYYGRLSERFEMEGELGGWLPIGGSAGVPVTNASGVVVPNSSGFAGNIFFYGIGPSYRVINDEQFQLSPVAELVGWNVTGGQETGAPLDASGTNIVNIKLGARMSFHARDSVYIGWGKALTSADWYNDIVRVEYRHAF
jgi:hypothetical protein